MKNLAQYRAEIKVETCKFCGTKFPNYIHAYPHNEGWPVEGYDFLFWLYIHCEGCGYDWSIWKLGASNREEEVKISEVEKKLDRGIHGSTP